MGFLQGVAKAIFGTSNDRLLKTLQPVVEKINAMEPEVRKLTDTELRESTAMFRERLKKKETLDDLLPEAFARVREAGRRFLNKRHYDVQLIGGMVLHRGMIAEMVTGEGKTLVATLPAYLNALNGKGCHVITVNDYLAQRDCDWMAPVYRGLGMTVGAIQSNMSSRDRHPHYAADITYGTNNEFGFDYLRDNMKSSLSLQVQGPLSYAIIDEVDSILIDEARTPLIISGSTTSEVEQYRQADRVVRQLGKPNKDTMENEYFSVQEKDHRVEMTEEGQEKVSELLGIDNIYSGGNMQWPHLIHNALKAHHLYRREEKYTIKEGKVVIVDDFTGRLMEGRRWSDGLHQAVEAKEERDGNGVRIREEQVTMATVTLQNYFRLYSKLSGMTGTAMTEAGEFAKIYNLDVVAIPTNRPLIRRGLGDLVFGTHKEKYESMADEMERIAGMGRPILVGTTSIERSDELSKLLTKRGYKLEQQNRALGDHRRHYVLNAKVSYENQYREADIVAQAGRRLLPEKVRDDLEALATGTKDATVDTALKAVTETGHKYKKSPGMVIIATNMAGRGTDILLGGNSAHFFYSYLVSEQAKRDLKAEKGGGAGEDGADTPDLFSEMHTMLTKTDLLPYAMKEPRTIPSEKERDGTQRALVEALLTLFNLTPYNFEDAAYNGVFEGWFDREDYQRFFGDSSRWTAAMTDLLDRTVNPVSDLGPARGIIADVIRLTLPIDDYLDRILLIQQKRAEESGHASAEVFETLRSPEWMERMRRGEELVRDCLFNKLLVLSPQFYDLKPLGLLPSQDPNERKVPYYFRAHEIGGLHIIGTERHESRRIDNQLRGRCGRQGDPGSSQFYLSLEDDLMRIFAGDNMRSLLQRFGLRDGNPIQSKIVTNSVERAQKKVEGRNFETRKNLLEYDEVMDRQRKTIYTMRQGVLEGLTDETDPLRFRALRIRRSQLEQLEASGPLTYDRWQPQWQREIEADILNEQKPLGERDEWLPVKPEIRQQYLHEIAKEKVTAELLRKLDEHSDPQLPAQEPDFEAFAEWFNKEFANDTDPVKAEVIADATVSDLADRLRLHAMWDRDPNLEKIEQETKKLNKRTIEEYATGDFQSNYGITMDDDDLTAIDGLTPKDAPALFREIYKRKCEDRREKIVGRDRLDQIGERLIASTGGWDLSNLVHWLNRTLLLKVESADLIGKTRAESEAFLVEKLESHYQEHEKETGEQLMRFIEQYVFLQTIDSRWKDHLREMDYLRSAVAFSGYVQKDPKVEYKIRGFENFQQMQEMIDRQFAEKVLRARLVEKDRLDNLANVWQGAEARKDAGASSAITEQERQAAANRSEQDRVANRPNQNSGPAEPIRKKYREPGPNEACPCGSGKKYKKCHMVKGGVDALPEDARKKLMVR